MPIRYRNGWWLEQKYCRERWTQREIAEECDVSPRTIRKYMQQFGIETRDQKGANHPLYGVERDDNVKEAISEALSGRTIDEEWREKIAEGLQGRTVPETVRNAISASLSGRSKSKQTCQKMSESTAGESNPNWAGGYSRRYGPGWAVAREHVIDRDEVCQHCGHDGTSNRLEVHHIIPVRVFRDAPDAAVTEAHHPSNLVLLCNSCHTRADFGNLGFDSGIDRPDNHHRS